MTLLWHKGSTLDSEHDNNDRAKFIIDSNADPGERLIARLFLDWKDDETCSFTVFNETLRDIRFNVRYHTRKDDVVYVAQNGEVISPGEHHTWDSITDCGSEGHCFLTADDNDDFDVKHFDAATQGFYAQASSAELWDDNQYAP
ncbi:hypothetical protein DFQ26_004551 [Actinomortierella ambigua]|nr:hypothetical protein DFQ26_004551 [Actinomortierella ambigua]